MSLKSIKKQKTWLPVFTGFYESGFDASHSYIERETCLSEEEFKEYFSELHEAGVTQEYFNNNLYNYLDYKAAYNESAEYIANSLMDLEHQGIILDVTYESLVSPKYYNFSNDSINCEIKYDSQKLMKYLRDNKAEFEQYITERYTSRSGFISSYSNQLDYWMDEDNHGEHEVGSLLNFVLFNEDEDAVVTLICESNVDEAFMNACNFDTKRMIQDYKKSLKKKA